MESRVLVCTTNIKNARKLVERGEKIAKAYNGKCFVLSVTREEYDEMNYNLYLHRKLLEKIVEEFDAELVYQSYKKEKLHEIITNVSLAFDIGHIIVGQSVRSKWNILKEGSLIDTLFAALKDVDLHIVEVDKEGMAEEEYQYGNHVYLRQFEGDFNAYLPNEDIQNKQGVFFKYAYTEFQNGIIRIQNTINGTVKEQLYHVVENEIMFDRPLYEF